MVRLCSSVSLICVLSLVHSLFAESILSTVDSGKALLRNNNFLAALIMTKHSRGFNKTITQVEGPLLNLAEVTGMDMSIYVKFYLYTRQNKDTFQEVKVDDPGALHSSNFNLSRPTVVVIHGYLNDIDSEAIQLIKNALLKSGDYNVIGVDWSRIAVTILYNVAAAETKHVGSYVGEFVQFLHGQGVPFQDVYIVGHSLGAHVAGFAGRSLAPNKIPRITGLDPAKPGFTSEGPDGRLDRSDAQFVDCIHTCAGQLGLADPVCSANYYPNGGKNPQPGCAWVDFIGVCSHIRSIEYYAESVDRGHLFQAAECAGGSSPPSKGTCKPSPALMGHPASPKYPGLFYVRTNNAYAYALVVKK